MRFVKTYWLEMLMVTPLFAYIIGFTLLPILTTIKESFIDQRFGRRYDILVTKIADIMDDLERAPDGEEKSVYEQELAEARLALEELRTFPGRRLESEQLSQAIHRSEFSPGHLQHDRHYPDRASGTGGDGYVDRPVTDPSVSTAKASSAPSC